MKPSLDPTPRRARRASRSPLLAGAVGIAVASLGVGWAAGCSPTVRVFGTGTGGSTSGSTSSATTGSTGSGGAATSASSTSSASSASGTATASTGASSGSGDAGCGDTTSDPFNCGMCGLACAKGQGCVASACVCDAVSCASGCCAGEACLSPGVTSCGTAGAACVECSKALQNAVNATCTATGTCDYGACLAGYADLDGNRANGCESTLPTGVPEAPSLVLWLAADTGWNGQAWLDQSGGGRDALPYVGAPGTGTLNGKSVVDFNGGSLLIPAGFPAWSGLTIFALANTSADDGLLTMGVSYNGSCDPSPPLGAAGCMPYDMLSFGAAMGLQQCDPQIGSCYQVYAPPIPLGAWVRSTAEEDPAANPSFRSFFNSVDNGAGSNHNLPYPYPPPWAAPRKDTIVGWRNYRGLVAEIIAFDAPLSDVSRKAVDAYLAAKWKVP